MGKETDKMKDHAYDGIQEYDNPLPAWWLVTFFATIIFGFHYWIYYEFGGGATLAQELKSDLSAIHATQPKDVKEDKEEDLKALLGSASAQKQGADVYTAKCAVCHGPELGGLIGPNLTDVYWINGKGKLVDIAGVVRKGVLDKGMPNWDTQLKDEEIKSVSAFVYAKRGTNPANPKAPQGEKVVDQ